MNYGITELVHQFLAEKIQEGDLCLDATAGNGHDTVFLCEQVGETGQVLAFDIQELAVEHTKKRLQERKFADRAQVYLDSHCNMHQYVKEQTVSCITFNLGYLPGGNHGVATRADTTIKALEISLRLLKKSGVISLVIYSGGDTGFEEKQAVLAWLKQLDEKKYLVLLGSYYNRPNHPPIPVWIVKC